MSFDEIFDLTAGVYFNFYNIWPLDSTKEHQAYKWTVYLPEGHKVTLITIYFFMRIIFFPR